MAINPHTQQLLRLTPYLLLAPCPVILVTVLPELLGRWGLILGSLFGFVALSQLSIHGVDYGVRFMQKRWSIQTPKFWAKYTWFPILCGLIFLNVAIYQVNGRHQREVRTRFTSALQPQISALLPKLSTSSLPNGFGLTVLPGVSAREVLAQTTRLKTLQLPYVFVYLGRKAGGCGCSNFQDESVLSNDEGVMTASDYGVPRILPVPARIKTLIFLRDGGQEKTTYNEIQKGSNIGQTVLSRGSYGVWAFDVQSGELVATGLLADDYLQTSYSNSNTNDKVEYSDLRRWADHLAQ